MKLKLLVPLLASFATACMPMVQHGPWVREGTSGGLLVAGARTNDQLDGDFPPTLIGFDGGLRKGFVPADSSRPAFAAGVQTSLWLVLLAANGEDLQQSLSFISVDGYTSFPLARHNASLGATASINHILPYIQFGTRSPVNGWYTTQAFLAIPEEDVFLWLPSITKVEQDRRPRATHFTIGGGIGKRSQQSYYLFNVGVYMEFFGRGRVR